MAFFYPFHPYLSYHHILYICLDMIKIIEDKIEQIILGSSFSSIREKRC